MNSNLFEKSQLKYVLKYEEDADEYKLNIDIVDNRKCLIKISADGETKNKSGNIKKAAAVCDDEDNDSKYDSSEEDREDDESEGGNDLELSYSVSVKDEDIKILGFFAEDYQDNIDDRFDVAVEFERFCLLYLLKKIYNEYRSNYKISYQEKCGQIDVNGKTLSALIAEIDGEFDSFKVISSAEDIIEIEIAAPSAADLKYIATYSEEIYYTDTISHRMNIQIADNRNSLIKIKGINDMYFEISSSDSIFVCGFRTNIYQEDTARVLKIDEHFEQFCFFYILRTICDKYKSTRNLKLEYHLDYEYMNQLSGKYEEKKLREVVKKCTIESIIEEMAAHFKSVKKIAADVIEIEV